jgi:hypothetical protein
MEKIYLNHFLLTKVMWGGLITIDFQLYGTMHPKGKYTDIRRDGNEW